MTSFGSSRETHRGRKVVLKNTSLVWLCWGTKRLFAFSPSFFCLLNKRKKRVENLSRGELGHGLGSLGHGVLGQLSGQDQTNGGLDLSGGDGGLLVVQGQTRRLGGDLVEHVVDERVHDGHGLGRDSSVGVDLLQHLVDVDLVGLRLGLALGLLSLRLLGGLLGRCPV